MIALPTFLYSKFKGGMSSSIISGRTKYVALLCLSLFSDHNRSYITAKKLLTDAADAVERLMLSVKEINELSGFTARVYGNFLCFDPFQFALCARTY
jgi:hypothetical protein